MIPFWSAFLVYVLIVMVDIDKFVRYEILLTFYFLVSFARCLQ